MPQVRRFEDLQIPTEDRAVEAPGELSVRARTPQAQIAEVKTEHPQLELVPPGTPPRRK